MSALKLIEVGSSTGIVLPEDVLARLRVERGDTVFAVETPEGFLLTALDPGVQEQMQVGRDGMEQFRETYERLAK